MQLFFSMHLHVNFFGIALSLCNNADQRKITILIASVLFTKMSIIKTFETNGVKYNVRTFCDSRWPSRLNMDINGRDHAGSSVNLLPSLSAGFSCRSDHRKDLRGKNGTHVTSFSCASRFFCSWLSFFFSQT